ncbi:MAG: flagellar basal-body MS-ring/collar protein FliF [Actinomycetota bacterium]
MAIDPRTSPGASGAKGADLLARITPLQKVAIGAAILTLVGGVFLISSGSDNTVMAAAYTDLEPADAAAVTDELISMGIDYELADGGRTVLVPRDDLYDVRVDLSGQGLPASNEGYALLDRQGITTSEFRQRIDYQRALEGELARTLRSIDGVSSATVHLALPEDSIFVDEPDQATASVLVATDGSSPITNDQVAAMVHLVSSSIADMSPDAVTIADASGRVLTDGGIDGMATGDAADDFERELAASIRTMVGRVAGIENVAVNVQADIDTTERLQTREVFDTTAEDAGVVIAERTSTETYAGTGDGPGDAGVLGPDGAPVGVDVGDGESSYARDDAERTFAVNRTVEQITNGPGQINQLSVAVLVDENAVTAEEVTALQQMVSTAAGVDAARGDVVTVTALPFEEVETIDAEEAMAADAAAEAAAAQTSMIRTGIIGFVLLIALFLAYRSTRRARREVSTPIDIESLRAGDEPAALEAGDVDAVVDAGDGLATEAQVNQAVAAVERAEPLGLGLDEDSVRAIDELGSYADRNPEDVARILQSWLADERQPS